MDKFWTVEEPDAAVTDRVTGPLPFDAVDGPDGGCVKVLGRQKMFSVVLSVATYRLL